VADLGTIKNTLTEVSAAPPSKTPSADSEVIKAPITETSLAKMPVNDLAAGDFSLANMQNSAPLTANILSTNSHHSLFKVETPLHDPAWASDFGQKVVWMASNHTQVAQITINPPDMGPIEISLTFNKDSASALFVSPHAEVRETIEAALPRLKEMLADVGIQLGQSNVGSESFRQQAGNQQARQDSPRWRADNAILDADLPGMPPRQADIAQRGNGRVDTFA
jgi:flagellar hook-length control protein FliK